MSLKQYKCGSDVKLQGFIYTPNIKLQYNKDGKPMIHFVVGYRKPQKSSDIDMPMPIENNHNLFKCIMSGRKAKIFHKKYKRYDFVRIHGEIETRDFYDENKDYIHIKGLTIICNKVYILTDEYNKQHDREAIKKEYEPHDTYIVVKESVLETQRKKRKFRNKKEYK